MGNPRRKCCTLVWVIKGVGMQVKLATRMATDRATKADQKMHGTKDKTKTMLTTGVGSKDIMARTLHAKQKGKCARNVAF